MLVYRILHKKWGDALFAPGLAGRWNSEGNKVLYCSESIPLAFMESMIRRQGVGFNDDFRIAHIRLPDKSAISEIFAKNLKPGWNDAFDYSLTQPIGDAWFEHTASLILKVPSATLNLCYNYVVNATHADFKKVKLEAFTPLMPDARIEAILKKSKQ